MPWDVTPPAKLMTGRTVLLIRAKERIAAPNRWAVGTEVSRWWWHRRYCPIGALYWAKDHYDLGDDSVAILRKPLDQAAKQHGFWGITALNDHPDTTHALVMQVMDEAIELSKVAAET